MFGLLLDDIERVKEYTEQTMFYKPEWKMIDLGNVTFKLKKVPSASKTRIYLSSSGFFINLEIRDSFTKKLIKLMKLFQLEIRRYDIVEYRLKEYFAYECYPDIENKVKIESFKEVNESGKIILLFYWILGIKGHYIKREDDFFPSEPYEIDFETSVISGRSSKKFIQNNREEIKNLMNKLVDHDKIIELQYILRHDRYWLVEAMKRIRMLY